MKKGIFFILLIAFIFAAFSYHFVFFESGFYVIKKEEAVIKNFLMFNDEEIRENKYVYDAILEKQKARKGFSSYGSDPDLLDDAE